MGAWGGGRRLGEVCSPAVPGPPGHSSAAAARGARKRVSGGRAKRLFKPRAREGVKVTENGDGNGNKRSGVGEGRRGWPGLRGERR